MLCSECSRLRTNDKNSDHEEELYGARSSSIQVPKNMMSCFRKSPSINNRYIPQAAAEFIIGNFMANVVRRRCKIMRSIAAWIVISAALLPVLMAAGDNIDELGPLSNVSKHLFFPDFRLPSKKLFHDIKLLGSASLAEEPGIIQIPADPEGNVSYQAGRAIYSSPVRLLDPRTRTPASFHTTFSFQIAGARPGSGPDSGSGRLRGGSGLTFILVPDEVTVGRPGPWLGMLNDACDDDYKAFAVEFDTHKNEEFGDPNDNHVGINLGSIISNTTIDAANAGVSFKNGSVVRAWINYDGNKKWIDLRLGREGKNGPSATIYSAPLDLSNFLNEYMFVGFSASTGRFTQIHNILSWNFSSTSQAHLRVPTERTCERKLNMWGRILSHRSKPRSAFLIFIAVVVLCLISLFSLYCNRNRGKRLPKNALMPGKIKHIRPRPPHKPRRFSLWELSVATRSFSEGEVLGCGDRGIFFKGTLQNTSSNTNNNTNGNAAGSLVAIKRFSPHLVVRGGLDRRKILREVAVLSRLRHPNLAPLRGWCNEKRELLVIYEYMPNGSLDKWLFARGVLPWTRRFRVVKDIAEALAFLHGGWEKNLVHKNVKMSNVLLDITFRAVLGDFGLINFPRDRVIAGPKSLQGINGIYNDRDREDRSSVIRPPEFVHPEQPVTDKIDVFGFGVMVLEILTGRRSVDRSLPKHEVDVVEWAWNMYENEKLIQVVDARLGSRYNPEQAFCLLVIGLVCTLNDPRMRPSMEDIVGYLNGEKPLPALPSSRPDTSFFYPSATDLCNLNSCSPHASINLPWRTKK